MIFYQLIGHRVMVPVNSSHGQLVVVIVRLFANIFRQTRYLKIQWTYGRLPKRQWTIDAGRLRT